MIAILIGLAMPACQNAREEYASVNDPSFEDIQSKFNTEIPENIMIPDRVDTRIGTLEFFDGLPSAATVEKVYDNLDFLRGVETFLNGIPITSIEGLKLGMKEIGAANSNKVVIRSDLMDSNPLFLTGNTSTVYASVILDLEKDAPTVVEVPAGRGPGTVKDAFFRFVIDMGMPGQLCSGGKGEQLAAIRSWERLVCASQALRATGSLV